MGVLRLVVIRSAHPAASRDFYAAIGLPLQTEQHGEGPVHQACAWEGLTFEIYPARPGQQVLHDEGMLGFEVLDMGRVLAALSALGLPTVEPRATPRGLRAVVRDPDGRAVELIERA